MLLSVNGFKRIAEIGVYNAEFSQVLWRNIPDIELYLVDPYIKYDDISITDTQEIHDTRYAMVKQLVQQARSRGKSVKLLRSTSVDALKQIPDNYLDLVYIDADHSYESVKQDVEGWYKKVKPGRILAGHDFLHNGVNKAVTEFVTKHNLQVEYFTLDDTWIIRKTVGEISDENTNIR